MLCWLWHTLHNLEHQQCYAGLEIEPAGEEKERVAWPEQLWTDDRGSNERGGISLASATVDRGWREQRWTKRDGGVS